MFCRHAIGNLTFPAVHRPGYSRPEFSLMLMLLFDVHARFLDAHAPTGLFAIRWFPTSSTHVTVFGTASQGF